MPSRWRAGAAGQVGGPDRPHPRRWRRANGSASFRRHAAQGRPVPAPALRHAPRHARARSVLRADGRGTIEVAPLAYMRGRTLNDSFIILDEAQNTTPEQMKMFLTRLGFGSKTVVTGDVTQIDLPDGRHRSGLLQVRSCARRDRRSGVRRSGLRRRGPPSDRAGDRRRLRPPRRRQHRGHANVEIKVGRRVPADERGGGIRRCSVPTSSATSRSTLRMGPPRAVGARRGARDRTARRRHRDVAALRRRDHHLRAERALPRRDRSHRCARLSD